MIELTFKYYLPAEMSNVETRPLLFDDGEYDVRWVLSGVVDCLVRELKFGVSGIGISGIGVDS